MNEMLVYVWRTERGPNKLGESIQVKRNIGRKCR